jgi:RNA polymerase sigma factor (sigma-70 family)
MLKTMRNSFHHLKWTLFVVIGVFVLGFVFFSGSGSSADPVGQVVAQVGSDRITAADFDRQYKAQVERYRQMYQGNFSPELERALDLPRNVLDSMIERILRLESARRFDLHVSDEELARKIVVLPYFQDQGQFIGREKYEKMLRGSGVVPERFEEDLREDLLLEKYGELVKASVVVPDADLLREALAALSPLDREILVAREVEGIPDREVAKRFDMTVTGVRVRMHRARKKMRAQFQEGKP